MSLQLRPMSCCLRPSNFPINHPNHPPRVAAPAVPTACGWYTGRIWSATNATRRANTKFLDTSARTTRRSRKSKKRYCTELPPPPPPPPLLLLLLLLQYQQDSNAVPCALCFESVSASVNRITSPPSVAEFIGCSHLCLPAAISLTPSLCLTVCARARVNRKHFPPLIHRCKHFLGWSANSKKRRPTRKQRCKPLPQPIRYRSEPHCHSSKCLVLLWSATTIHTPHRARHRWSRHDMTRW
jgi:hypothetical protein